MSLHSLDQGTILVTGGAGFIGSAVVWALNQRGLENILVSDLLGTDEKWRNLVPLRFADYIEADDLQMLVDKNDAAVADVKTVIHLGACSATTERDAAYLIHNNYEWTKTLAHWSVENARRFVYASSAATYGDGDEGMEDRDDHLASLRPLNMYGYSKHLFDLYAKRHGLLPHIVGLKYFNVFGPNEWHKGEMRSLVNKAYDQILASGSLRLFKSHHPHYPDGGQKRDFLYVKDAVAMTLYLAEAPGASGLFNLGSGEANTWLTLAQGLFDALGRPAQIEFIDIPENIRANYQYFTQANIVKLRESGYTAPVFPLREAVSDYALNYLIPRRHLGD